MNKINEVLDVLANLVVKVLIIALCVRGIVALVHGILK